MPSYRSVAFLTLCMFSTVLLSVTKGGFHLLGEGLLLLILGLLIWICLRFPELTRKKISPLNWNRMFFVLTAYTGLTLLNLRPLQYPDPNRIWISNLATKLTVFIFFGLVGRAVFLKFRSKTGALFLKRAILVAIGLFYVHVPFTSLNPKIDVMQFQKEAAEVLLQGKNPYQWTFQNVYQHKKNWYPGSGEPEFYPYPPVTFVTAVLGKIMGDVRFLYLLCFFGFALLVYGMGRNIFAENELFYFVFISFYIPVGPFVLEQGWTEPLLTTLIAGMVWFLLDQKSKRAEWIAGAIVAFKQTMILLPVAYFSLIRGSFLARLIRLTSLSIISYGIFLLWDAKALIEDVVWFHLKSPFRKEGLTLSALSYHWTGNPLPGWVPVLGIIFGGFLSALIWKNIRKKPQWFSLGFLMSLSIFYFSTLILSKHAFANYYYFVHCLFILSLFVSRRLDVKAA